jgi:hypothetical protein
MLTPPLYCWPADRKPCHTISVTEDTRVLVRAARHPANATMPHQQHIRMLSVARDLLAPVAAAATRTSLELMLPCVRASRCLQQQQCSGAGSGHLK